MEKIDCIIMCAGRGKRLMPLTVDRPKAMVEVKGRPLIYWIINSLLKSNIPLGEIFIITGYKGGKLKSYIKYTFPSNSFKFIHQKKRTGTADAIYLVKDFMDIKNDFIVISGDVIYTPEDLNRLSSMPNALLYTEQDERLYEYGTIDLVKDQFPEECGYTIKFINEKTSRPTSNKINCGAYSFTREVFRYIKDTPYDFRFNERIITNTINLMIDDGIDFRGLYIKKLNEITYPSDIELVEQMIDEKS